jgi:hypothetical protein
MRLHRRLYWSYRMIWGESSVNDQDARPPAAGNLAP